LAGSDKRRVVLLLLIVVILILGASFAYSYEQDSDVTSSLNQTITSRESLINSQVSRLSIDLNEMTNLTAIVSSLRSQVSTLQSQISYDQAEINSLTAGYSQANTTEGSQQSQVSNLDSKIANLDAQVATFNTQIATYQSEIASLQTQVRQLESALTVIDVALYDPVVQLMESNLRFSVPAGSDEQFQVTSISVGSVLLVGIVSSTSSNTMVSLSENTDPVDVGRSGIAAFILNECCGENYTLSIYSQNMTSFTATVNIWYFHA
jgi:predicted RNase H-like nuclease (RuvC/YqgF family)